MATLNSNSAPVEWLFATAEGLATGHAPYSYRRERWGYQGPFGFTAVSDADAPAIERLAQFGEICGAGSWTPTQIMGESFDRVTSWMFTNATALENIESGL